MLRGHRSDLGERCRAAENRERRRHPAAAHRLGVHVDGSGKDDQRNTGRGQLANPVDHLAVERLRVEGSFGRNDHVRSAHNLARPHRFTDELPPRNELGTEERKEERGETAGRTEPGHLLNLTSALGTHDRGEPRQAALQLADVVGRGTLLRAEDVRRTARSRQRVRHVRGDAPAHGAYTRVHACQVDAREISERTPAIGQLRPRRVLKARAEFA